VERFSAMPKLAGVVPGSRLNVRPAPEMTSSGIAEFDQLTGGIPRGCLTQVFGSASSGRTSLLLSVLAASTERGEVCALVDVSDALDPLSAQAAGVHFEKLLWVRCGVRKSPVAKTSDRSMETPVDQALRVTDLLLQSGGFGLVIIDLGDVPDKFVRRIPLTSWFRFQRAVENTPTVLFVVAPVPCAPSCASLLLKLSASEKKLSTKNYQLLTEHHQSHPTHSLLLDGLHIQSELLRSRMDRKPVRSVTTFSTRAARAG